MRTEYVTAVMDGTPYAGWERVTITAAINEAARTFQLETTERIGKYKFPPGTAAKIYATGDLVVDGFTNRYSTSGDASSHQITISGRGRGQDFIDCAAAKHKTGFRKDATTLDFARELDEFGVGITASVALKELPMHMLAQGETAFQTIERYARQQGVTMMGRSDGAIELTNASVAKRHSGSLMEGWNIKQYQGEISDDRRHSEHHVKGQGRHGSGQAVLRIEETVSDSGVTRYRPRIIINEGDTDKGRARDRATHEKERAAGRSVKCSITIPSWRDEGGKLWEPNHLVYVRSPILLHISQDMLIEKVTLNQDNGSGGTWADLDLVDPRTYRGKAGSSESDGAWTRGMD